MKKASDLYLRYEPMCCYPFVFSVCIAFKTAKRVLAANSNDENLKNGGKIGSRCDNVGQPQFKKCLKPAIFPFCKTK